MVATHLDIIPSFLISGAGSIFFFFFSISIHLLHAIRHHLYVPFFFFFLPVQQKLTPVSMSWLRHGWRTTIAANNESDWTMLLA